MEKRNLVESVTDGFVSMFALYQLEIILEVSLKRLLWHIGPDA